MVRASPLSLNEFFVCMVFISKPVAYAKDEYVKYFAAEIPETKQSPINSVLRKAQSLAASPSGAIPPFSAGSSGWDSGSEEESSLLFPPTTICVSSLLSSGSEELWSELSEDAPLSSSLFIKSEAIWKKSRKAFGSLQSLAAPSGYFFSSYFCQPQAIRQEDAITATAIIAAFIALLYFLVCKTAGFRLNTRFPPFFRQQIG